MLDTEARADALRRSLPPALPVPVERLAHSLGIIVRKAPAPPGLYGALFLVRGRTYVLLSTRQSPERARFTLAHEMGHLLLMPRAAALCYDPHRNDAEERLADQFAAALLMPADLVRYFWAKGEAFTSLAARFGVSYTAMHRRLVELGLV